MATQPEDLGAGLHQEALADFVLIRTDQVDQGERLRPVDLVWAEALGQIMTRDGQRTPVEVCRLPGQARWTLVSGGHRLAGAQSADIAYLRAEIVGADRDDRRLREVSENLWRRDLAPIDRAAFVAEAVAIHKRRAGIDPAKDGRAASIAVRWQKAVKDEAADTTATIAGVYGFSAAVAGEMGLSTRTVENDLMLYRRLAPSLVERLRSARHPVMGNATQLRLLAKLDADDQVQVVDRLLGVDPWEPCKTVAEAARRLNPGKGPQDAEAKRFAAALGMLRRMSARERLALFQSGAFHDLIPAEASALLAPMRRQPDPTGTQDDASTEDLPPNAGCDEARVAGHGRPAGGDRTDAVRKHGDRGTAGEGERLHAVAMAPGSRVSAGSTSRLGDVGHLVAHITGQLAEGLDPDWIIHELVRRFGAKVRSHTGTYELKACGVPATCTAGGAGLLRAWLRAADRRIKQAQSLGLFKVEAA